ncbi:hypothetical protein NMY22_g9426 [Coprinellus aureogranulatus]|nr:hypothetical protein NMY22_g9426 [Coprinellus aureogranulatus]
MSVRHLTQPPPSHGDFRASDVPSIRLISAIPSASGAAQASPSLKVFDETIMTSSSNPTPWDSMPPPSPSPLLTKRKSSSKLLPKASSNALRNDASATPKPTRLVPKKSKRRLLGSLGNALPTKDKENGRGKDFSDVIRRVASGTQNAAQGGSLVGSAKLKGGFDIYVDPAADPDMGDILVVKKQKSRAALNDMGWGPIAGASETRGVLGEVTNNSSSGTVNGGGKKEKEAVGPLAKVKLDDERKWWSIGRGRKEVKEVKENVAKERSSSPTPRPPPRSKTPDPFKGTSAQSDSMRSRFNSLDAGILLGINRKKSSPTVLSPPTPVAEPVADPSPPPTMRTHTRRKSYGNILSNPQLHPQTQMKKMERIPTPPQMTYSRSATPTFGGLLSLGSNQTQNPGIEEQFGGHGNAAANQGSIALRAMRSVRSIARLGSRSGKGEDGSKEKKEKKEKEKKKAKEGGEGEKKLRSGNLDSNRNEDWYAQYQAKHPGNGAPVVHASPAVEVGVNGVECIRRCSFAYVSNSTRSTPSQRSFRHHDFYPLHGVQQHRSTSGRWGHDNLAPRIHRLQHHARRHSKNLRTIHSLIYPPDIHRVGELRCVGRVEDVERPVFEWSVYSVGRGGNQEGEGGEGEGDVVQEAYGHVADRRKLTERKESGKESRSGTEARKRMALSDIFPELAGGAGTTKQSTEPEKEEEARRFPILTIEEATADGHGDDLDEPIVEESEGEEEEKVEVVATPMKKRRVRPLSEQLAGKPRPMAFREDEDGVLDILSAATHDLAQLINNLDLEATPATPDLTPLKPSTPFAHDLSTSTEYNGSPLKSKKKSDSLHPGVKNARGTLASESSISSLRQYSKSSTVNGGHPTIRSKPSISAAMLGKAIPSWPLPENTSLASLRANLKPVVSPPKRSEPVKEKKAPSPTLPSVIKARKRTMSPARQLDSTSSQLPQAKRSTKSVKAKVTPERIKDTFDDSSEDEKYRTLRPKTSSGKGSLEHAFEAVKTIGKGSRKSSKMSTASSRSAGSKRSGPLERGVPISKEARRMLGMSGTMGGSVVSGHHVELDDNSDPDYDVPEELKRILKKDSSDTISYQSVHIHDGERSDEEEEYRDDDSFTGRLRTSSAFSFNPSSLGGSRSMQSLSQAEIHHAQRLPVFRAQLITDTATQDAEIDDGFSSPDENATKKSFDFTGELAKLAAECGGCDSRSFVEEVEKAFQTPSKVDLGANFGVARDIPPVPPLPEFAIMDLKTSSPRSSQKELSQSYETSLSFGAEGSSEMRAPVFVSEPRTGGSKKGSKQSSIEFNSSDHSSEVEQGSLDIPFLSVSPASASGTVRSKASISPPVSHKADRSDGELNRSFKFGGLSAASPSPPRVIEHRAEDNLSDGDEFSEDETHESHCRPLTLSDVIPPPSRVREVSFSSSMLDEYEDSALRSVLAQTMSGSQGASSEASGDIPQPRQRTISAASYSSSNFIPLTRPSSGVSFGGLDSFDQVRRGFEFHDQRPNWYPSVQAAPAARSRPHYRPRDSVFSIASVSSYGRVIRDGAPDPFDYGMMPPMPSLQEGYYEDTMSARSSMYSNRTSLDMSTQVEDTFSFIHNRPIPRRRVDSDANSFYLHPQAPAVVRGGRRRDSTFSVTSVSGMPPR